MLLPDLVRLVHVHADEMVEELVESLRADPNVPYLRIIGDEDLRQRVVEVYRHCAEWASARVNQVGRADAFERGYTDLGRLRRTEQVPASQVIYALIRAKEHLVDFVKRNAAVDNSVELYQESELEEAIHGFFDRAVYYVLRGYERADEEKARG